MSLQSPALDRTFRSHFQVPPLAAVRSPVAGAPTPPRSTHRGVDHLGERSEVLAPVGLGSGDGLVARGRPCSGKVGEVRWMS